MADIRANFKQIAIVRLFDERNRHIGIAERAQILGLSLTTYVYFLDTYTSIVCNASRRAVEILRSQYVSLLNQPLPPMTDTRETKRHRATKYEVDMLCAHCYDMYLNGIQADIKNYWYYVERHNELYGTDPHYTAIFNGNQHRIDTLIKIKGADAYRSAP